MNPPLLMLLFLLWSGFALADPASLPDELAEEAGMLGSILSDGRAVFYPESASYLSLSSLNGPPGYSNGVAVLMTLGGAGGEAEQPTISTLPCTLSTTVSLVCRRSKPTACFLFVTLGGARVTACSLALAKPEQASSCPGLAMRLKTHSAARPNHWRSPSPSGGRAVSLSRQPLQHSVMRVPDSRTSQLQPNSKKFIPIRHLSPVFYPPGASGRFLVAI